MLSAKQPAPPIDTVSLSGYHVDLAQFRGKTVLVKFHRFSGCPVARRQVHELIEEQAALTAAGIETIVVLHSSAAKMQPNFNEVPGLHLVADPRKALYRAYHAEFRWRKLFSFASWRETVVSFARGYFPQFTRFQGGIVGVPCDFLVDEQGTIATTHYGTHFGDSWSAADALRAAGSSMTTGRAASTLRIRGRNRGHANGEPVVYLGPPHRGYNRKTAGRKEIQQRGSREW